MYVLINQMVVDMPLMVKLIFRALQQLNPNLQQSPYPRQICGVYISALNLNDTIFANLTFNKLTYLHGFHFLVYERFTGNGSTEVELQYAKWIATLGFDPLPVFEECH